MAMESRAGPRMPHQSPSPLLQLPTERVGSQALMFLGKGAAAIPAIPHLDNVQLQLTLATEDEVP